MEVSKFYSIITQPTLPPPNQTQLSIVYTLFLICNLLLIPSLYSSSTIISFVFQPNHVYPDFFPKPSIHLVLILTFPSAIVFLRRSSNAFVFSTNVAFVTFFLFFFFIHFHWFWLLTVLSQRFDFVAFVVLRDSTHQTKIYSQTQTDDNGGIYNT